MAAGIVRIVAALFVVLSMVLSGAATANATPLAANHIVAIQNFTFVPASVTVSAGDTVSWMNTDVAAHSARSATGVFDTGTLGQGQGKTITFPVPGTFPYICGIHGASMSGTIIVTGAATPTPPSTLPPTAPPTPVPTAPPTPQPTVAPTPTRTSTPSPSPSVTTSAPATASTTPTALVAADSDSAPGPLLVVGGAVLIVGLLGAAFVLLRR